MRRALLLGIGLFVLPSVGEAQVEIGVDNVYLRGEVVVTYVREAGSGASQFGFGGAVGTKRQIGDGPVFLRFEGGVDRLLENDDFFSTNEFRALVGLSVVVN